jgi:hypothetical protein
MTDVDYIIGSFDPKTDKYKKEYGGQGNYFKDTKAFREKSTSVCYIPETSDTHYIYTDFLRIAKGNTKLAVILFEMVDWQSPELLFNDLLDSGEIDVDGNLLN